MVKVVSFQMPFKTNHFNLNQRVWVISTTGALAAYATGKYRGKHRYVKAWVKYDSKDRPKPMFQEIDVDTNFAKRHGLMIAPL